MHYGELKVEDSAEGLVTYKNGVKYGFYAMNNYGCNEPIEIRLLCENGKVVFGYDDAVITYADGTKEEVHAAPLPVLLMVKEYSREAPLVIVVAMRSRLAVSRARGERA